MNIICFPFIFYNCEQTLFILRGSLLLTSLKNASVDILGHEGSFEFSPTAQFTSPLYVHITLATDTKPESPHFTQRLTRQC